MKRMLLPPLVISFILLTLAAFCFIAEQREPLATRDDSVRFASVLVLGASIAGYPILLIINLLDSVFDRHGFRSWLWTAGLVSGFATITVLGKAGSETLGALILGALLFPAVLLLPMSVMRRLMTPRQPGDVFSPEHLPQVSYHGRPPSLSRKWAQNKTGKATAGSPVVSSESTSPPPHP